MHGNPIQRLNMLSTSFPTRPSADTVHQGPMWVMGLGIPVYCLIHTILRWALDLRDLPGSASTLSILYTTDNVNGSDAASYTFSWLQFWLGMSLEHSIYLVSIVSGLSMVIGLILVAGSIWNRKAAMWAGLMGACWQLSQQMGLLVGLDPLAIGCTWLGLGVLSVALHSNWKGLLALPLAWWILTVGLNVKSIALPSLVVLSGVAFPNHKWKPWLIGMVSTGLFATTLSGTSDHRVVPPNLNFKSIEYGWHQISTLSKRGIPEGDFKILLYVGGILTLHALGYRLWKKRFSNPQLLLPILAGLTLWIASGIGLCITAAGLGELSRPRYLIGTGIGLIVPIAGALSIYKHSLAKMIGLSVIGAMLMNTWGFFDQWGQIRYNMLGGETSHIPKAPSIWKRKFQQYPILTLRDLTIMGALDFQDTWHSIPNTKGIAVPRLRDDRHRNLEAYAAIKGQSILILDPGKCCAGTPVNSQCANNIVKQLDRAHLTIVLPTVVEGIERVHANERTWVEDLRQEIVENGTQSQYWHWHKPTYEGESEERPCQFDIPQQLKH